ncbi:MAG: ATP-binding protein [Deinococcaceae bacterium]
MKVVTSWLNQISIRLVLAMVLVTLMSILSMFVSTNIIVQKQFVRFEPEIRSQLTEAFQNDAHLLKSIASYTPNHDSEPNIFTSMGTFGPALPIELAFKKPPPPPDLLLPWRRVRKISENPRYRSELLQTIGLSALLSIAFGTVLALLLARRIAHPLIAVSVAATEIAEGDLAARARLLPREISGQDEASSLARNFNEMAETLERLERERRNMIADIAHELRTPLTILQSHFDAFEDGIIPLNLEEIASLSLQTQLLTRLVEDLRILSLADAGRLSIRKQYVSLCTLVEDVLSNFQERLNQKHISVVTNLNTEVTIHADADRLTQVLVNLLENALRYTPQHGWIRVELKRNGNYAQLLLTDSGSGIQPENLERVFDRFFRESWARNREHGGTGLGLSIVKTLLELQGGTVTAHNMLGAGAQFLISLPLINTTKHGVVSPI